MTRPFSRLIPLVLATALLAGPATLSAQLLTNPLTTAELYRNARARLERVNPQCKGPLNNYLEAAVYMYAFLQAAGRDGALKSDPTFAYTFRERFDGVLIIAERCLKAYPPASSAGMRSDGPESSAREVMPPGVALQDLPAGLGVSPQTDAQGRTIPELVAIIEQFPQERAMYRVEITRVEQQRDAFAAEINRLRNVQPTPTPQPPPPETPTAARTGVEYRVRTKADNLYWHLAGNTDNLLSTRTQPNDDFTRFIIESSGDGGWRIRNKATGSYLYADGANNNYLIFGMHGNQDDHSVFLMYLQPDGSYRIANRLTGRYLHQDGNNSRFVSTLYQADDDFTRFYFVP